MNCLSLENKLFLMQAIAKTNKDFENNQYLDEDTILLDKTKELLEALENVTSRLNTLQDSKSDLTG